MSALPHPPFNYYPLWLEKTHWILEKELFRNNQKFHWIHPLFEMAKGQWKEWIWSYWYQKIRAIWCHVIHPIRILRWQIERSGAWGKTAKFGTVCWAPKYYSGYMHCHRNIVGQCLEEGHDEKYQGISQDLKIGCLNWKTGRQNLFGNFSANRICLTLLCTVHLP